MKARYYDTSVILSMLMHDAHASRALEVWEGDHARVSSKLFLFESFTVIERHARRLPKGTAKVWQSEARGWLERVASSMIIHEVNDAVLKRLPDAIQGADIRTLDAIHLATAEIFATETAIEVVSFDARLLAAARALRLAVVE